jgi:hypothetical protein
LRWLPRSTTTTTTSSASPTFELQKGSGSGQTPSDARECARANRHGGLAHPCRLSRGSCGSGGTSTYRGHAAGRSSETEAGNDQCVRRSDRGDRAHQLRPEAVDKPGSLVLRSALRKYWSLLQYRPYVHRAQSASLAACPRHQRVTDCTAPSLPGGGECISAGVPRGSCRWRAQKGLLSCGTDPDWTHPRWQWPQCG